MENLHVQIQWRRKIISEEFLAIMLHPYETKYALLRIVVLYF